MNATTSCIALALFCQVSLSQCTITGTGAVDPAPPADSWSPTNHAIGFAFPFNGATYTDFYYSDHGLIALNNAGVPAPPAGGAQVWTPGTAGLATFGADVICAYWGDHTVGGGSVHLDNSSQSHCTITWVNSEPYQNFFAGAFTAQVTLYPSGDIRINLDHRCNNTSSTYGSHETIVGVHQDGNAVPASVDLSSGATSTSNASCFELFAGPGPTNLNSPDPNFDLGDTTLDFIPANPGWLVLINSPVACASSTSTGSGCDGLSLSATALPVMGGSWDLELSGIAAPAPIPNFLAFGLATSPASLAAILPSLFSPGCEGHQDLAFGVFGIGPAAGGVASVSVPIPNETSLRGYSVTAQGLAINPTTGMLGASNGHTAVLGH